MLNEAVTVMLLGAQVDAASPRRRSDVSNKCEAIVRLPGTRRPHLEVLAVRSRILGDMGQEQESAIARAGARRIADEIAAGFENPDLRASFVAAM